MANLSNAHGTFEIRANNKEIITTLIHLMQRSLENCEYGTFFTDYHYGDDQFNIDPINENQFEFSTVFDGTGRWVYSNNIESMLRWMKEDATNEEIEYLKNKDFTYIFDFVDYEPGCEAFYRSVMEVTHKKGDPLEQTTVQETELEGLDITFVNIAEGFGYSFVETMDELYWDVENCDEERKAEILENLHKQRAEIENYFNKPLETLLQYYPHLI